MPRFDVTTIGEGQLRYSVPPGTRLEEATQLDVYFTGTEANVVCNLARLGWQTGWVSALPTTPLGQRVINVLKPSGVNLEAVVRSPNTRLATYYVEYAVPPRSTQVYYDRANTAFTQLKRADINWDYLLDTKLLHISGLSVPLSKTVAEILSEALTRAKAKGVKVSFDMNYRTRIWTPEEAWAAVAPFVREVDILFFARRDAQQLFNIGNDPQEAIQHLRSVSNAQFIATSLGADGIIGWDGETMTCAPARQVTVLDRIGAGDAMVSGVLHGWLQNDFAKGLRYGTLTAALALTQFGDQIITNKDEVEMLVDADDSADIVR